MIKEARKFQINIFGESYTIISDEAEAEVLNTISQVNSLMKDIASKSGSSDAKKISIFASLQLTKKVNDLEIEIKKLKEEKDKIVSKIENEIIRLSF